MFLSHRSTQAEYTDAPDLPMSTVQNNYRELGRVNRVLMHADPFKRLLPPWLGSNRCRQLHLLDLGAGDGTLGAELTHWAAKRGWQWRVTHLDANPLALRLNRGISRIAGRVSNLPFADNSFDLVIASQMTHHLNGEPLRQHFREAWRVTRDAVFFSDIHRNAAVYGALWILLRVLRLSPLMCHDGLLSVKRGWRLPEWRQLATASGMENSRVWLYYGSRILLRARKQPTTA